MGIKDAIIKGAKKAGDAVARVSQLSPEQLESVWEAREAYLEGKPEMDDPAAVERTERLLAACAVEIFNAQLPEIKERYAPVNPSCEYEGGFNPGNNVRFMRIGKWVVDPEENSLEKLVNVYDVVSREYCNIALIFYRTHSSVDAFIGVMNAKNSNSNEDVDSLKKRIMQALKGNFPGSEVVDWDEDPLDELTNHKCSVAAVSNVPAEKSERFTSQTIEKVLDGVVPEAGKPYAIVLLASPIRDVAERKMRLAELHTSLAPYASWQTGYTYSDSASVMAGATVGVNAGVSAGVQNGTNTSIANNASVADQTSDAQTQQSSDAISDAETHMEQTGEGRTRSTQEGSSEQVQAGFSLTENVSHSVGTNASANVGVPGANATAGVSSETTLGMSAQESISRAKTTTHSTSDALSTSKAVADTVGRTVSKTTGEAVTKTLGRAVTRGVARTAGAFRSTSLGGNIGASFARTSSVTATIGKNETITQTFSNYAVKHALEVLESQMERYDLASALGMWDFAAYFIGEDHEVVGNAANSYLALTQGEESHMSFAAVNLWRGDMADAQWESRSAKAICEYLHDLRHPIFGLVEGLIEREPESAAFPVLTSATTALSGKELAYSLNFPRKSVPGLPVIECVGFGRSVSRFVDFVEDDGSIDLGRVFHMHQEEPARVFLSRRSLASHVFVTGSTGTGKTNTVCRIIDQAMSSDVGFLVIEPAKGEYKDVYGGEDGVAVYATNPNVAPLLKINPFSFPEGVHVLEHLDRLIEVFNVCWPMYAAMPAVLKDAVERSYVDCGWDLIESTNRYGEGLYPCFADVAKNVRAILDESEYDAENKGAYKGSLLTRLKSLTNGINGMVFADDEVSAEDLFDSRAIIDLSRVGSLETKSLIMGLLVLKLQEHRMVTSRGANLPLKHLTILEEAHNLLKRASSVQQGEGGNLMGKSVEMISNAIAEMRTYGEGFVIADQAPGLLDMAAIRNTNTKIIMRLPDLSDRELAGRAAGLNDSQIVELARLPKGVAAVYQNDWIEPVLCKVGKAEEGRRFEYVRATSASSERDEGDTRRALAVASALARCERLSGSATLDELREALSQLGLSASLRVSALKMLENPPEEPRMTKLAPLMAALFPEVSEAALRAIERTSEVSEWTKAVESAVKRTVGSDLEDVVRRTIVQGCIQNCVLNELHNDAAFKDWYLRGGMK